MAIDSNTSKFYNLFVLRRLYNKGNAGRGIEGEVRRVSLHTTVTPLSFNLLESIVPTGKGKYSAPVVELGIRIQLALLGVLSMDTLSEELVMAVSDRDTLVANLRKLAIAVSTYQPR